MSSAVLEKTYTQSTEALDCGKQKVHRSRLFKKELPLGYEAYSCVLDDPGNPIDLSDESMGELVITFQDASLDIILEEQETYAQEHEKELTYWNARNSL